MNPVIILGMSAGILTSFAGFPQLYRVLTTKQTKDLSLIMFSMIVLGVLLWLIYGIIILDLPLIIFNSISLITNGMILFYKIRFG